MALIGEKSFTISPINGNGFGSAGNKFNYYSQTSLLSTRVEFKSAKEHSPDESSDEEESDNLKAKYIHLKPDSTSEVRAVGANKGGAGALQAKLAAKQQSTNNHDLQPKPTNSKDGNELGQPKLILYPRERINALLEWKKMNRIGAGLGNLGNTCFLNSVLQCLTYCPPLVNYLNTTRDEHVSKCRQNFCMICLLTNHINNALLRVTPVVKPYPICQRIKSIAKHFTFGRQEDSHEFLRYVIDHLWRSCLAIHEQDLGISGTTAKLDHLTKSTTAINHIFGGYHRSQVSCLNCKEKSNTYDYFMDFMLEIQNVSSLQEALQKFVTPETLCHENAYKCSKCKKSVSARKQFTVYRAPNVATFQFKRFDCTRIFGKISKAITYPEKLNLAPYMSDKSAPIMYKLISVLVHHGQSSNSGHYFCYVRNSNNSWYQMDDSHVGQVSLEEVLRQKAYVLFYIRTTPETASQPQFQVYNKLPPKLVCLRFHKEHSDSEKLERAHNEKKDKKKKKRKKDKDRQKRRDNDDSDDKTELSWVERTKETLELENKSQHKSNDYLEKRKHSFLEQESSTTAGDFVIDHLDKRKHSHLEQESSTTAGDGAEKKLKPSPVESSRKTDVLDFLLKGALPKGFNENAVKTWNGESSNLNRSITEDNKKSTVYDYDEDEYNNEFDQGMTKKTKKPMEKVDVFQRSSVKSNPFQRAAGFNRYGSNNSNSYHNNSSNGSQSWFNSSFHKMPANKFNGLSNKPFTKFGEGGSGSGGSSGGSHHRHFEKHYKDSFEKHNYHPYSNNHHRPSSNGGYHQKFFKHR